MSEREIRGNDIVELFVMFVLMIILGYMIYLEPIALIEVVIPGIAITVAVCWVWNKIMKWWETR